jgi:MFS family permease
VEREGPSKERVAVISLMVLRIVYAVNTLNIGAIFFLIGSDINAGVNGLASLTSSFYIGIGVMQVPGGILAAKWGPKKVLALGMVVSSIAVICTSVTTTLLEFSTLRLIVGGGMALVFAPGVVLISRLFGSGRSGHGVALFNSANGIGGLIGLFGWILVALALGWRVSVALGGVLGLLTAFFLLRYAPDDEGELKKSRLMLSELGKVLKDKSMILLGIGTLGISLAYALESNFMAYYLHERLGEAPTIAGLIASMVVIIPIFFSLWGGRLYDMTRNPTRLLILPGIGLAGSLALCAIPDVYGALAGTILGGATFGVGFTVAIAIATDYNISGRAFAGLTVAWVNGISLSGLFLPPLVFSQLAEHMGYSAAWVGGAGLTILLITPFVFVTSRTWASDSQGSSSPLT